MNRYSITLFKRVFFWRHYSNLGQCLIFFFNESKNVASFTTVVIFGVPSNIRNHAYDFCDIDGFFSHVAQAHKEKKISVQRLNGHSLSPFVAATR